MKLLLCDGKNTPTRKLLKPFFFCFWVVFKHDHWFCKFLIAFFQHFSDEILLTTHSFMKHRTKKLLKLYPFIWKWKKKISFLINIFSIFFFSLLFFCSSSINCPSNCLENHLYPFDSHYNFTTI